MLCDVKNHLLREANLTTKTVRTVAGKVGVRGHDLRGGKKGTDQELISPWDIVLDEESGKFIICMAGSHQIWEHDPKNNTCSRFSGSGGEGNYNSSAAQSTWA